MARALSEEEICQFLKSLNVPTHMNDLKTPTKEFILRVFVSFFMDLGVEAGPALSFEHYKNIENPEILEESQSLILNVSMINRLLGGVVTLNIKDINEPKPKRTKKILNHLIFFWNYYLKKMSEYKCVEESYKSMFEEIQAILKEIDDLRDKIQDKQSILEHIQVDKKELIAKHAANAERAKEWEKQWALANKTYEELKKKQQSCIAENHDIDVRILSLKEQITDFEEMIIKSPDRPIAEIQKIKDQIKAEESKFQEKHKELQNKTEQIDCLEAALAENLKKMENLKIIDESIIKEMKNHAQSLVACAQEWQREEHDIQNFENELKKKEWNNVRITSREAILQLSSRKQMDSSYDHMNEIHADMEKQKARLSAVRTSIARITKKFDDSVDQVLEIIQKCKTAESETQKSIETYQQKLMHKVKEFETDCEDVVNTTKKVFKL